jgi:hypothetical protein
MLSGNLYATLKEYAPPYLFALSGPGQNHPAEAIYINGDRFCCARCPKRSDTDLETSVRNVAINMLESV